MNRSPLLEVRDLTVTAGHGAHAVRLVDRMSFDIAEGETVGMAGASGSGKTLTALAILGLLPAPLTASGSVRWRGRELLGRSHHELRVVRGAGIGFVPQDALTSLHPFMRLDRQVAESIHAHHPGLGQREALQQAASLLASMGVPRSPSGYAGYAFQWSGGMRQRALIAMAIANDPALLIADEPTTALDLRTQAAVLTLLRDAQRRTGSAMLLITHDMAVVRQVAHRVLVVGSGGHVVEQGDIDTLLAEHRHPDTLHLLSALRAEHGMAPPQLPEPTGPELLRVHDLCVRFGPRGWFSRQRGWTTAVEDVCFSLRAGETLGIVGESGAGKSTLTRALVGLERAHHGGVVLGGQNLAQIRGRALRSARAAIQLVFQDPEASLNPRRRIGSSVAEPLRAHGRYRAAGGEQRVRSLLEEVGLPAAYAERFPHELSGGERQRAAIARALALEPRILVLDEPVTSLDAATRGGIVRLLNAIQANRGMAMVVIAHDLRLVRGLAHTVAVMRHGRFVESAPAAVLFDSPQHEYTRELLALTPQCACCAVRLPAADL
ncbi:ABC transporter ATP-binding protein [soil metagenome]